VKKGVGVVFMNDKKKFMVMWVAWTLIN
jgi:hypothetical protein